ncbi:MAG: hypothetical protein SGPRY_012737, partial [Prymnesium sp.]
DLKLDKLVLLSAVGFNDMDGSLETGRHPTPRKLQELVRFGHTALRVHGGAANYKLPQGKKLRSRVQQVIALACSSRGWRICSRHWKP